MMSYSVVRAFSENFPGCQKLKNEKHIPNFKPNEKTIKHFDEDKNGKKYPERENTYHKNSFPTYVFTQ